MKPQPPKYVKLKNTALRLTDDGKEYYRDGGHWSVGFKYIDGKWLSWHWVKGFRGLHRIELVEISM